MIILTGYITKEEHKELVALEYVLTHGYSESPEKDNDRYMELSEKKYYKVGDTMKCISDPCIFSDDCYFVIDLKVEGYSYKLRERLDNCKLERVFSITSYSKYIVHGYNPRMLLLERKK